MTPKFLYTLITPEGIEVLVGAFANNAIATRAIRRKHAADCGLVAARLLSAPAARGAAWREGPGSMTTPARRVRLASRPWSGTAPNVKAIYDYMVPSVNRSGKLHHARGAPRRG